MGRRCASAAGRPGVDRPHHVLQPAAVQQTVLVQQQTLARALVLTHLG